MADPAPGAKVAARRANCAGDASDADEAMQFLNLHYEWHSHKRLDGNFR